MTLHHRITAVSIALLSLLAAAPIAQKGYLKFTDPTKRFTIEFPNGWDWVIVEPAGEPIATFVHPKKEAAIVVERKRLPFALKADEINDGLMDGEVLGVKKEQPRAVVTTSKFIPVNGKKVVQVDYTRPGAVGEPNKIPMEQVRQFSFVVETNLYHVTCFAIDKAFPRYETIFQWVVNSFVPGEELPR